MATRQAVWGIDVGQCALKAIRLQAAGEKVEVLASDVIEHEKILSHPEADAPALIRAALAKFVSRNEIKGDLVAIAVPGQQTLSRFTKLPPVEPRRIPDIVRFEAGQQIPFDMDEVVWDYQPFMEPDSPEVEVGIFAIRKELIRAHVDYFTAAGIEPVLAQASPLALYNAVRFDRPLGEGATILLDVGAQATDLIIMEGNSIWARPVPLGGNAFTEALVKSFRLSHAKAENLKRTAATTKYARQVFQAMRPVFADLVSEVQRSIGFYTATHRDSQVARILAVGNAFSMPGLQKFLQQNLQITVEALTTFARATPAAGVNASEFAARVPSMVVAYGLAVQGLGLAAISSSLLPPEITRQIVWRRKRPAFAAAAACLLGAAGIIWGSNASAESSLKSQMGSGRTRAIPDAAAAEQLLRGGPGNQTAFEYARSVVDAVTKLQQEYQAAAAGEGGSAGVIELFRTVGPAVPLVPRIYQVIHEALRNQAPEAVQASDGSQYAAVIAAAKKKRDDLLRVGVRPDDPQIRELDRIANRQQRDEVWIEDMQMRYYPDVGGVTAGLPGIKPEEVQEVTGRPGWHVRLTCRTTNPEPAGWLEDKVLPRLEAGGRAPKMGFFIYRARLFSLRTMPEPTGAEEEPGLPAPGAVRGAQPPRMRGPGGGFGAAPPPAKPPPAGTTEAPEYRVPRGFDPLTLEPAAGKDSQFIVDLVILKADTPEKYLPKPAASAPAAGAAAGGPRPPGGTPPVPGGRD